MSETTPSGIQASSPERSTTATNVGVSTVIPASDSSRSATNWKEWLEQHPLVVLAAIVVATCSATFAVVDYFNGQHLTLIGKHHETEITNLGAEHAAKIHDLESRLLAITRKVGEEAAWDVSSIMVTARQTRALGPEFKHFEDINCYISVPTGPTWSYKRMTETELAGSILGPEIAEFLAGSQLGGLASAFPISVWQAADTLRVDTGDPDLPSLTLFPFVGVQTFDTRKLAELTGKLVDQEIAASRESAARELSSLLESIAPEAADDDPEAHNAEPPGSAASTEPAAGDVFSVRSETQADLERMFDADMTTVLLMGQLMSGMGMTQLVKGSSFRVLNAEKKGNVLYLHAQVLFPARNGKPKIYWDREIVCISNKGSSLLIQMSAPSLDQRPMEAVWIASWLSGLRIPLE